MAVCMQMVSLHSPSMSLMHENVTCMSRWSIMYVGECMVGECMVGECMVGECMVGECMVGT